MGCPEGWCPQSPAFTDPVLLPPDNTRLPRAEGWLSQCPFPSSLGGKGWHCALVPCPGSPPGEALGHFPKEVGMAPRLLSAPQESSSHSA